MDPVPQTASRIGRVGLAGLTAAALLLLLWEVPRRGFDPDEFEHVHVAWCIQHGEVPYRDFFEHHGPLLGWLAQPLFAGLEDELDIFPRGRGVMLACSLGMLAACGILARRLGGELAGWIAVCLLAWSTVFQAKAIEFRPDVPAALCLSLAALACFGAERPPSTSPLRLAGAALAAGAATLFTQKSIVPVAGLALACSTIDFLRGARAWWLTGAALFAGVGAAWGSVWLGFAAIGAADDFVQSTFWQLLAWPVRSRRWDQLRPTLSGDFTLWAAALAEVVLVVVEMFRTRGRGEPDASPDNRLGLVIASAWCVASLVWVKAVYAQFYLLWFPWMGVLAGCAIARWLAIVPSPRVWRAAGVGALGLVAIEGVLWWRGIRAGSDGALARLPADGPLHLVLLVAAGGIVCLLLAGWARSRWTWFVTALAIAGCWYGVLRDADFASWTNRRQLEGVAAVNRIVGPDETVLDGFTGYGCLRRHALPHWWLNEYSIPLMPRDELDEMVPRLSASPPAVVLFDSEMQRLPAETLGWIEDHYRPIEPAPLRVPR